MADSRTPNEIERDIERERSELANTVEELQDRFSPDRIMTEIGRGVSEHGGDLAKAVSESVKQNPIALTLTGIGLAWLMAGRSWENRGNSDDDVKALPSPDRADTYTGARHRRAVGRRGDVVVGGTARGSATYPDGTDFNDVEDQDDRWLYADDPQRWHDDDDGPSWTQKVTGALSGAASSVGSAAASARDGIASAAGSTRDGIASAAGATRDGVYSAAGSVSGGVSSAGRSVGSAGRSAQDRAAIMRARLSRGTEDMSDAARERIIQARWQAVKARRAAARHARRGADGIGGFIDENPLVAGALALAAGAALAGGLPRTRQEDDWFGERSDRATDEAERIYQSEKRKLKDVANRAADEAGAVIDEKRKKIDDTAPGQKSAAEQARDEVRDGVSRVVDAAKDEAQTKDLGSPAR